MSLIHVDTFEVVKDDDTSFSLLILVNKVTMQPTILDTHVGANIITKWMLV